MKRIWKRTYSLQIVDNTKKIFSKPIPNWTTDQADFREWFESNTYVDMIFVPTKIRNKNEVTNDQIVASKAWRNVNYLEARFLATEYIKEKTCFKNLDYLTHDFNLRSIEKGKDICQKMNWKQASNGIVVFEGWEYYKNNELIELNDDDRKFSYKTTKTAMWFLTGFFLLCFGLTWIPPNLPEQYSQEDREYLMQGLTYLSFIGGVLYSSIISPVREEYSNNVKSKDKILGHNMILESPFWISQITVIITFVYNGLPFWETFILSFVVFILLMVKLTVDYDSDVKKYESNRLNKKLME